MNRSLKCACISGMELLFLGSALGAEMVNPIADPQNTPGVSESLVWKDSTLSTTVRIKDLIGCMSLEEKVQQLRNQAPAIPRLGLPSYDYWNECLHGVARAGTATVFPQAIGLAATWDTNVMLRVADAIATEGRAKNNYYRSKNGGNSAKYLGLTYWAPNINIFRDPRWGRGQETYGEDPFLTARMGVAFIQGLQGDDPKYIKAMAGAKHFAMYSGPGILSHHFNVDPSERDLYETYLPQFEAAVREGHVGIVMAAYNAVYGKPSSASSFLLTDILRNRWGFTGHVVSDSSGVRDILTGYHLAQTREEAAALALKAGTDLCCGWDYEPLVQSVSNGLVSPQEIDTALSRVLESRFRLGMFDPPEKVPYTRIPLTENDSAAHRQLALDMARESVVLLKNDGTLPLDRTKIKRIAVFGTNAMSKAMLLGNYAGTPSKSVTILDGIKTLVGKGVQVDFSSGCPLASQTNDPLLGTGFLKQSADSTSDADVIIYVGGLNSRLEAESIATPFEGFSEGDRTRIELPSVQTDFIKALQATGKPVIFINCGGSAIAFPWEAEHLPAIVEAWYPGEEGGQAVAEVLFGLVNPAGRLPVTFYRSTTDLPDFENYSMSNRTYRYFTGKPLYAFGHGLSYTQFGYSNPILEKTTIKSSDTVRLTFNLANEGRCDGDEVPQVYFRYVNSAVPQPRLALCSFTRVHIVHGKTMTVTLEIPAERFRYWDTTEKDYTVESGDYELLIGGASDDIRQRVSLKVADR